MNQQAQGGREYDAVVVGGGVVGAAIARELTPYFSSLAIVDARPDIGAGTTKANTAILHTGFDAAPGTLEAQLVARGYHLTRDYCDEAKINYEQLGAVLIAWTDEQFEALPGLAEKAAKNGYLETKILSRDEVFELVPNAHESALGGLLVPGESIIDPWSVPLAFATDAVNRGAEFLPNMKILDVEVLDDHTVLRTNAGDIKAKWVINAAGLGADEIERLYGYSRLESHPRKGELIVFDKLATRLVDRIILPVPSKLGKGVLVSPTIFGNVMLGPTAEDMTDRQDTSTTEAGFEFLLEKGKGIIPELLDEEVIASYAGLRAAHNLSDYLIELDADQRYVVAAAVRSTGLTSALAIAEYIRQLLADAKVLATEPRKVPPTVQMPPLGEHALRPFANDELIKSDACYGEMVCFCERVTRGEIRDAFETPIPPPDLEGLRRRTRAMNGRCQGFFCGAEVKELLAKNVGEAK